MRLIRSFLPLLFALALVSPPSPAAAFVTVGVNITLAPPPLPVYVQPAIPAPGYIWTPGYWAYGPDGYYWVPGTWVMPPSVGLLWTPGYWGWNSGSYGWHEGYWGPHVGFYGGVNYGFGYTGVGYLGGFWDRGVFSYNHSVNNFGNVHITNVYSRTVVNNVSRVSFNGGTGGTRFHPSAQEEAAARERHVGATELQSHHEGAAAGNRALLASVNRGRPTVAATPRAGEFSGRGIVATRGVAGPQHGTRAGTIGGPRPASARPPGQNGNRPAGAHPAGVNRQASVRPQATHAAQPRTSGPPRTASAPRAPSAPRASSPRPQGQSHEGGGGRERRE